MRGSNNKKERDIRGGELRHRKAAKGEGGGSAPLTVLRASDRTGRSRGNSKRPRRRELKISRKRVLSSFYGLFLLQGAR